MSIPSLTIEDIQEIIPTAEKVETPIPGGQKQVFPVLIAGTCYIIKFIRVNSQDVIPEPDGNILVERRLQREVEILKKCDSPYLVKLGPIAITYINFKNQHLFYYSEEIINGNDLKTLLFHNYKFSFTEIIKLALDINNAIKELWKYQYIHRDIKPENIIYDKVNNKFVLIDPGVAFDLNGDSFTNPGLAVGTLIFLSPDQLNYHGRRNLDFRSDHFALGVVLYLLITGKHPFIPNDCCSQEIISNILNLKPIAPIDLISDMPPLLNTLILRLLSKQPHLRFRTCDILENELKKLV